MESRPVRAASYCRLSLARMGDTTNVDDQDRINHRLAKARGWTIASEHVYKDNSRSAWQRDRKRPGWDAMVAAVERGELDAIIIYHGDRIVRQPRDMLDLMDMAAGQGMRLASPTGEYNLDDPDHQMMLTWIAARAKNEIDHLSRRMKEGHRRRGERGYVRAGGRGGRPFGFEKDCATHVPDEVELIREAARRVLNTEPVGAIVGDWNARGLTTTAGGPWTHTTLKKMLMRPRLAGLMPDGEQQAAWEPVLAADRDAAVEMWRSLVAVLSQKAGDFGYATNVRRYLLSGIAVCGSCQAPVAIRHNRRGKTLLGYGCVNPDCSRKVHRKAEHVDGYVTGRLVELLNDREFLAGLGEGRDPELAGQIQALEVRKAQTKRQLENLADHPNLTPDLLIKSLASFDRRIGELRERVRVTEQQRLLIEYAGLTLERWLDLPLEMQRALIVAGYALIEIEPTGRRGPGFDPDSVVLTRRPVG
jgi:DNA invertase Pin-like site-specific DNA recombinase